MNESQTITIETSMLLVPPKGPIVPDLPSEQMGRVSDGYHTFDELYEHRCLLFVCLLNACVELGVENQSFKTRKDDKGNPVHDGWFIAGIDSEFGQITYHLPDKYWNLVNVNTRPFNRNYDGHTSHDVVKRLENLAEWWAG